MPKKITTEIFKQRVYDLVGDEYTVLGEYVEALTKIAMKHNICGYEWDITPNSFQSGTRCPRCAGYVRLTTEIFKQRVYDLVGDEYTVLGDYERALIKIAMKHNICGHEWGITPASFQTGKRCPRCAGHVRLTTEIFKQRVYNLVGDEYTVLGNCVNATTKIAMKHNICGYEWTIVPNSFQSGARCPRCNESHGEKQVSALLRKYSIPVIAQYKKVRNPKTGRLLPYDFNVKYNNINYLIEFDGIQHFEPVEYFGGEEAFKDNQYRDNIKNEYVKKYPDKYKLLRIPYTKEDAMERLIREYLPDELFNDMPMEG